MAAPHFQIRSSTTGSSHSEFFLSSWPTWGSMHNSLSVERVMSRQDNVSHLFQHCWRRSIRALSVHAWNIKHDAVCMGVKIVEQDFDHLVVSFDMTKLVHKNLRRPNCIASVSFLAEWNLSFTVRTWRLSFVSCRFLDSYDHLPVPVRKFWLFCFMV